MNNTNDIDLQTSQLDLMILENVNSGKWELEIPLDINSKFIRTKYKERGFICSDDIINKKTIISWRNPDLKIETRNVNKKQIIQITSFFTAEQLYLLMTRGKDLRYLTSVMVYERLIRELNVEETYGMDRNAVYYLYKNALDKIIDESIYNIVINDYGVIHSQKTYAENDGTNVVVVPNVGIEW